MQHLVSATAGRWYAVIATNNRPTGQLARRVITWTIEDHHPWPNQTQPGDRTHVLDHHGSLVRASKLGDVRAVLDPARAPKATERPTHRRSTKGNQR